MTEANGEVRYKLTEVCRLADVQPYVLRYWESEFASLAPDRTIPGPRTYSARELKVVERIKKLLYDEGYTIAGAKKRLDSEMKEDEPGAGSVPIMAVPITDATAVLATQPPLPPKPKPRKAAAQVQPALAELLLDEVVPPRPRPPPEPKPEPVKSVDSAAPMVVQLADPRVARALADLKEIHSLLSRDEP